MCAQVFKRRKEEGVEELIAPQIAGNADGRSRGESVHRGTAALMAARRGGSVHGGANYWRIMRAAATAAKWNNRE